MQCVKVNVITVSESVLNQKVFILRFAEQSVPWRFPSWPTTSRFCHC